MHLQTPLTLNCNRSPLKGDLKLSLTLLTHFTQNDHFLTQKRKTSTKGELSL